MERRVDAGSRSILVTIAWVSAVTGRFPALCGMSGLVGSGSADVR